MMEPEPATASGAGPEAPQPVIRGPRGRGRAGPGRARVLVTRGPFLRHGYWSLGGPSLTWV